MCARCRLQSTWLRRVQVHRFCLPLVHRRASLSLHGHRPHPLSSHPRPPHFPRHGPHPPPGSLPHFRRLTHPCVNRLPTELFGSLASIYSLSLTDKYPFIETWEEGSLNQRLSCLYLPPLIAFFRSVMRRRPSTSLTDERAVQTRIAASLM